MSSGPTSNAASRMPQSLATQDSGSGKKAGNIHEKDSPAMAPESAGAGTRDLSRAAAPQTGSKVEGGRISRGADTSSSSDMKNTYSEFD